MATVIIGGGIIGLSTAFYLSQNPSTTNPEDIHIVEAAAELFASASGYAAGFLAADWYSAPVAPLGRLSFDLHKQLASQHHGAENWGYSKSTGTSWTEGRSKAKHSGADWLREGGSRGELAGSHEFKQGNGPAWLRQRAGGRLDIISEDDTTAQVDPLRLCRFLLEACQSRGIHLHHPAKPTAVGCDSSGTIESVTVERTTASDLASSSSSTTIPCTRLILTAGAWTGRVFGTLFPSSRTRLPISSLAGHSLVLRSPRWKAGDEAPLGAAGRGGVHAVFTTDDDGWSPELFSRTGGEIYIAGLNDADLPLPELATDRKIDGDKIKSLRQTARRLLANGSTDGDEDTDELEIVREGLCFRPVTNRGSAIIGRIDDAKLGKGIRTKEEGGVYMAAGHGPWGISLSLGTGKVMSEIIEGRQTSCDVLGLTL